MSLKKKIVSKNSAVSSKSTTPANVASTNPVPTSVSTPPEGWLKPIKLGKKGRRPKNGLTLATPSIVTELRANAAALVDELGPKAIDPQQLAAALDLAQGWKGAEEKAANFHLYVRSERGAAWDAALTLMNGMKLGVQFALSRDPTFADRFPGIAKVFASARRPKRATAAATPATPAAPKVTSRKASAVAPSDGAAAAAATQAPQEAAPETAATA